ncbi:MAG TPA: hypothetical protein VEF34_10365, partial [Syntrophobacteraceae bacterium]|nr:hypothetical protein [Syntrophobacteraceae bacterium]
MRSVLNTVATISVLLICITVQPVLSAEWSDFSLGYRYGQEFREPGIDKDIKKNIITFTSLNGYQTGSNFMNLDVLISDKNDPAQGNDMGATELFLVYIQQFSYGKILNEKPLNFGILKDVSLSVGCELSAKNTAFAANKAAFIAGPTLNLAVPTPIPGFLDFSVMLYKEWGHDGINRQQIDYDPTYLLVATWRIPFDIAPLHLNFKGCASYVGKKGKTGFGEETEPELLLDAYLMVDIGALFGKAKIAWLGTGVEYWKNKYGNP